MKNIVFNLEEKPRFPSEAWFFDSYVLNIRTSFKCKSLLAARNIMMIKKKAMSCVITRL